MDNTQKTAVHPSRSSKNCRDCRYLTSLSATWYCDHPSLPVSIISGQPATSCHSARENGPCGNEATLFAVPLPRKQRIKVKVGDGYEWRDAIEELDAMPPTPDWDGAPRLEAWLAESSQPQQPPEHGASFELPTANKTAASLQSQHSVGGLS